MTEREYKVLEKFANESGINEEDELEKRIIRYFYLIGIIEKDVKFNDNGEDYEVARLTPWGKEIYHELRRLESPFWRFIYRNFLL